MRRVIAPLAALLMLGAAACGGNNVSSAKSGGGGASDGGGSSASAIKVGVVYSKSGLLAAYGKEFIEGVQAGLDYATKGTDKVDGHPITLVEKDDTGDPATAVSAAKDLIGQGIKIIGGSTSSGVALQVAPVAAQNKVLFISGPAATDAVTGINHYTFRSGRETYQDVMTAASFVGDASGKKVLVFAQDSAFGQANGAAVKAVLGAKGASVDQLLVPMDAKDFTPFSQQIKQKKPDLLFVAWAGETAPAMWQTLDQQGVFDATQVVTGLDTSATFKLYGATATKIKFLAHYFPAAADNPVNTAMINWCKSHGTQADLFTPDGFVWAQMVVHALQASTTDVDAMIGALEGWTFDAPKGSQTIRKEDHAMLQPMFTAQLVDNGGTLEAKLLNTVPADQVAPPVASK